jgi:hypothetical protein
VIAWAEVVQLNKTWETLFNLAKDEAWNPKQRLACVGGIKSEMFTDDKEHILIVKKAY